MRTLNEQDIRHLAGAVEFLTEKANFARMSREQLAHEWDLWRKFKDPATPQNIAIAEQEAEKDEAQCVAQAKQVVQILESFRGTSVQSSAIAASLAQTLQTAAELELPDYMDAAIQARGIEVLQRMCQQPGGDGLEVSLAALLLTAGRTGEAVELLKTSQKASPTNMEQRPMWRKIAVQLLELGKVEEAGSVLDAAVETARGNQRTSAALRAIFTEFMSPSDYRLARTVTGHLRKAGFDAKRATKLLFIGVRDEGLRRQALETIVWLDPEGASSALWLDGLSDGSPAVRLYAARALGDVGKSYMVKDYAEHLKKETNDEVKRALTASLARIDDEPRTLIEKLLRRRPWAK